MNILNKLNSKYLKMNKERTIATIVGMMIGIAMILAVSMLVESSKQIMSQTFASEKGSAEAVFQNLNDKQLADIKENKKIKNVAPFVDKGRFTITNQKDKVGKYNVEVNLVYVDNKTLKENEDIYFSKYIEGRLPENENEILITADVQYGFGKDSILDQYIDIKDGNNIIKQNVKVVGITPGNNIVYRPMFMLKDFEKEGVLKENGKKGYTIQFKNKATASKDFREIVLNNKMVASKEEINYSENVYYNDYLLMPYDSSSTNRNNTMLFIVQTFLFVVIGIATILVIYNSFIICITERRKDYGILISVGASKKQISKMVKREAFIMATIGILLGFTLGLVGIKILYLILNKFLQAIMTVQKAPQYLLDAVSLKMVFNKIVILTTIVLTYIITYIGILRPARKAAKTSPIESIKGIDEYKISPRKVRTTKLSRKILGIEGDLANKNLKRSKSKYRITIVSLTVSIVIFLVVTNLVLLSSISANNMSPDIYKKADIVTSHSIYSIRKRHPSDFETNEKNIKENEDNKEITKKTMIALDKRLNYKTNYEDKKMGNILSIPGSRAVLEFKDFNLNKKGSKEYFDYVNKMVKLGEKEYERNNALNGSVFGTMYEKADVLKEKMPVKILGAEGKILDEYLKKNKISELKDGEMVLVGSFIKDDKVKLYNSNIVDSVKYDKAKLYEEEAMPSKTSNEKSKYVYGKIDDVNIVKVIHDGDFPLMQNHEYSYDAGILLMNVNTFKKLSEKTNIAVDELNKTYKEEYNANKRDRYQGEEYTLVGDKVHKEETNKEIDTNPFHIPAIELNTLYTTKKMTENEINEMEKTLESFKIEKMEDISVYTNTVNISKMMVTVRSIQTIMLILVYGFILLIVAISVTNVFNTISTNIILRQREFANLKSMGMTKWQMRKMLDFESILYGVKVMVYGTAISYILMKILERLTRGQTTISIGISLKSVIIAGIGVMIIILTTMRYARRKVDNMNIIDVIKKGSI